MEVADTTVATTVEIPASTRTGRGRCDPDPEPKADSKLNIVNRYEGYLSERWVNDPQCLRCPPLLRW